MNASKMMGQEVVLKEEWLLKWMSVQKEFYCKCKFYQELATVKPVIYDQCLLRPPGGQRVVREG